MGNTVPPRTFWGQKFHAELGFVTSLPFATHNCHSVELCQPRAYGSYSFAAGGPSKWEGAGRTRCRPEPSPAHDRPPPRAPPSPVRGARRVAVLCRLGRPIPPPTS